VQDRKCDDTEAGGMLVKKGDGEEVMSEGEQNHY